MGSLGRAESSGSYHHHGITIGQLITFAAKDLKTPEEWEAERRAIEAMDSPWARHWEQEQTRRALEFIDEKENRETSTLDQYRDGKHGYYIPGVGYLIPEDESEDE